MSYYRRQLRWSIPLACLIVASVAWCFPNPFILMLWGGGTVYSSGYSEWAFRKVHVGDSKESVTERLGQPLQIVAANGPEENTMWKQSPPLAKNVENKPGVEFQYSLPVDQTNKTHYVRSVVFDATGKVSEIRKDVWVD